MKVDVTNSVGVRVFRTASRDTNQIIRSKFNYFRRAVFRLVQVRKKSIDHRVKFSAPFNIELFFYGSF